MRSGKKSLYILFPIVVGIWATIFFKISEALGDGEEVVSRPVKILNKTTTVAVQKDTFSLLSLNRDPFLGKIYKKKTVAKANKSSPSTLVEWPSIRYMGMVSGKEKSPVIYLIEIDQNQFLVEEKDEVDGVLVLRSKPGKIVLKYSGQIKAFEKS